MQLVGRQLPGFQVSSPSTLPHGERSNVLNKHVTITLTTALLTMQLHRIIYSRCQVDVSRGLLAEFELGSRCRVASQSLHLFSVGIAQPSSDCGDIFHPQRQVPGGCAAN